MTSFGEILTGLREGRGLTMYRLAKRMGCSQSAVSRWESGERVPNVWSMRWLADALELEGEERDRFFLAAGHIPPDIDPAAMLAACRAIRGEEAA